MYDIVFTLQQLDRRNAVILVGIFSCLHNSSHVVHPAVNDLEWISQLLLELLHYFIHESAVIVIHGDAV